MRRSLLSRLRRWADRDDAGAAIVMTMFVIALLTAIGVTVVTISVKNLDNAGADRQALSALANSEAGVAQAVSYLKRSGVGGLACSPTCTANPWGNSTAPYSFTVGSGDRYRVWIEKIQPLDVTTGTPGTYRIHSVGTSGNAPGSRTVTTDVQVAPFKFPIGVFSDSVQAGGNGSIQRESLFSTGCIYKRSKINFQGVDKVYGIPAAAHSAQYVTDSQGSGSACPSSDKKNIHTPSKSGPQPCNTTYPYDQDAQGGPLSGTSCDRAYNGTYPTTSRIGSVEEMAKTYGFQPEGLTASQLDLLRTAAMEQGFYFTNTTAIPAVLGDSTASLNYPNPVLFYDLQGSAVGGLVDLNDLSSTYGRATPVAPGDSGCNGRNVVVVVRNGNVRMNSNSVLVASVFALGPAPYGNVTKANGTANLIGTIYARSLDLTGTANVDLDDCFLANPPGGLLNVTVTNFREVDR